MYYVCTFNCATNCCKFIHWTLVATCDPWKGGKGWKELPIAHFYCNPPGTGNLLKPHCLNKMKFLALWISHRPPHHLPCFLHGIAWIPHKQFEEWVLDIKKKIKVESGTYSYSLITAAHTPLFLKFFHINIAASRFWRYPSFQGSLLETFAEE